MICMAVFIVKHKQKELFSILDKLIVMITEPEVADIFPCLEFVHMLSMFNI